MSDAGAARFYGGSLDPTAQEFRPRICPQNPIHLPMVQPQIYYSYSTPVPEFHLAPSFYHPLPSPPAPFQPHPPSPAPTRALLLTSVPYNVSESELRRELEIFGDVRAVQMERLLRDGIVTVHFYDLRHATSALDEIRRQHMMQQSRLRHHFESLFLQNSIFAMQPPPPPPLPPLSPGLISGHAVWAQYTIPVAAVLPDGLNQGTIVVFNLDCNVSTAHLTEIFQGFGAVKELRETPMKPNQRFVEFYDTRDAARALAVMNGGEINGRQVVIEFSRPGGGHGRRFTKHQNNYPLIPSRNFRFSPPSPPPPPPLRSPPRSTSISSRNAESVTGTGEEELEFEKTSFGKAASKKIAKKCQSNMTSSSSSKEYSKGGLKGGKNMDPRFLIDEDAIMDPTNCRDPRTTVMIKNIPNKYSQKLLLNMLDNHCITNNEKISKAGGCGGGGGEAGEGDQPFSAYDFIYLPIDFTNKCNVGYGFVNMTTPQATWRLYKAFHHQNWEVFNSKKICQVTYARLQGVEALKEHFKNSKFPCESEDYLPVIFSPPRDGKLLSEPLPIVHLSYSYSTDSTPANIKPPEEDLREAAVSGETNVQRGGGGENDDECDIPKEEEQ